MVNEFVKVYLIENIEEYGKFIAYCINNDVSVFRSYWDEREKGNRCFSINWLEKRCYYSSREYYEEHNFKILTPEFYFDVYGDVRIK